MLDIRQINPVARAVGVISAVAVLATATTLALTSDAQLTNNTVASATAGLLVDGPDANPNNSSADFSESEQGFNFSGLIPGGNYSDAQQFRLLNEGDAALTIKVGTTSGTEQGDLDETKVIVKFTNVDTNDVAEYSLASLQELAGKDLPGVSGEDFLATGDIDTFNVQVKFNDGAVTGESASFENFNLVFEGTAVEEPEI